MNKEEMINRLTRIETLLTGANGQNGIAGEQKELKTKMGDMESFMVEIKTQMNSINTNFENFRKSVSRWSIGIIFSVIVPLVLILINFLFKNPVR